jgi:hypothetical protein
MSNQRAIKEVRDGSSLAWAFYRPDEVTSFKGQVEVRLNATPEAVAAFVPPGRWSVDRVQWGDTLFLRREQSLERAAVKEMLVEILQFAAANEFGFHSWMHGPDLDK